MGSVRCPGKVLHEVDGKPLLQYLIERLQHCKFENTIVIATSGEEDDDPVAAFCEKMGVACHRGPLLDVAARFKQVLDRFRFDVFVRISGDSPLLDPRLVDEAVDVFLNNDFEIVTNVLPRTYPNGQSVEVIRSDIFIQHYPLMQEERDLEHVTRFFYKNRENFNIFNLASKDDYGGIHLSVDTFQDMKAFETVVANMNKPHLEYGLQDIHRLYRDLVH